MCVSTKHELIEQICSDEQRETVAVCQSGKKSFRFRASGRSERRTGCSLAYAINPVNGKHTPIWIADYVLASYGTGAIMAVPLMMSETMLSRKNSIWRLFLCIP